MWDGEQAGEDFPTVIVCLMCGASNPAGSNICEKCGAKLPKLDQRTAGGLASARQTVKYEKLRAQILKVKTGEQSWVEFYDWFLPFYEDIDQRIKSLVDGINQSHGSGWNYYEEYTEEVETTFAGVEDYDMALHQIFESIEAQDLVMAQAALKLFLRGAEKLNDAYVLNAETQRKLEEGWGYL